MTIIVEDVSKSYGRIKALDQLSISVREGEIFGLLGANGAGKTTLIKILVGALKPESGSVSVMGLHPTRDKDTLRPQIGYMPQQAALYDDLTARENVRFFGRARPIPNIEDRIREVLEFLKLSDRIDDPVYGYSGGMKQRVSLGCALVHQPRLLLLDEPSTGVDPKLRELLWAHFRELTQSGTTILISTHQMDEALHCDRVAIMRNGNTLAVDSPAELLSRGMANVKIWRGETLEQHNLENYRDELPVLLGVGSDIQKIEVREATLEEIVLDLISGKPG